MRWRELEGGGRRRQQERESSAFDSANVTATPQCAGAGVSLPRLTCDTAQVMVSFGALPCPFDDLYDRTHGQANTFAKRGDPNSREVYLTPSCVCPALTGCAMKL